MGGWVGGWVGIMHAYARKHMLSGHGCDTCVERLHAVMYLGCVSKKAVLVCGCVCVQAGPGVAAAVDRVEHVGVRAGAVGQPCRPRQGKDGHTTHTHTHTHIPSPPASHRRRTTSGTRSSSSVLVRVPAPPSHAHRCYRASPARPPRRTYTARATSSTRCVRQALPSTTPHPPTALRPTPAFRVPTTHTHTHTHTHTGGAP
jgi:hypothetical protein